ncbi:integrase catalytic domain-containing protein [Trichonephila clavipes]|nr:integrase catalytic domain-containing protein [Trichonephila clavipes]
MPLSRDPSCLGDSKQMSLRRLNSLWRRLVQDPKILELDRNFIHEYLDMGHMEEVVEDEDSAIVYYLSHHCVHRQEARKWFGPPFLHQYKELEPYDITAVEGDDLFLQELKETSDFPLCALLKTLNHWI